MTWVWRSSYFGTTWTDALEAARADALRKHSVEQINQRDPWLTNGEAVAIIDEMKRAARAAGTSFPLWDQWEALAYGYDGRQFYPDDQRRVNLFPDDYTSDLWSWLAEIAGQVDRTDTSGGARVIMPDETSWSRESMLARQALADNGGECRVPLPGIPPEQWPKCEEVIDKIKKRLPPVEEVLPITKPIMALKRLLPLIVITAVAAYLLNDGE